MSVTTVATPEVSLELALEHGLTEEEYDWILEKLGRTPSFVELGIYSVMWSEHCSYKNSIKYIKTLPNEGKRLLVGAGEENAGLVDIGDGLAVAFKMESHNHPSAIEPYQGAATGVGGIHRDIFTMGARPICALNALRFGPLRDARVRFLLDGVVRGIGDYGNSFGVPTVAGEVFFDASYEGNPLVNAMSVGVVEHGKTASAIATGAGNAVYIVGSDTGRDGIHGATFASEEISEESEAKRPSVQVGDPFTEKLLLEATLEAIDKDLVVGVQDMGAAGITCSCTEMSEKGEHGMVIHLERVPTREEGMTPYEIMLSESQERMLIICRPEKEEALKEIFDKWDLNAAHIGEVTEGSQVKVYWHGELVADVDAPHLCLGGGAPVYDREKERPAYIDEVQAFDISTLPDLTSANAGATLLQLLAAPNISSKRWVFEQYDTMVRTNTLVGPGPSDAAVVRVKGTDKGLAVKTDCNPRYVYLNPRRGAQIAVAESARNVVCVGGEPLAITNCLNFGNPYKPEMYWTFVEAVGGIGDACRALETPVTGGNVSFYNENPEGAVFPTPGIGMLGLVEDTERDTTRAAPQHVGDAVVLLSPETWMHRNDVGGSEYLATLHNRTAGDAPHLNLEEERAVQQTLLGLIRQGLVSSAHDISDGGLAVCLAEKVIFSEGLGLDIAIHQPEDLRLDALLFGEAQSRIVITVSPDNLDEVMAVDGVTATRIGEVTEQARFKLRVGDTDLFNFSADTIELPYTRTLPQAMDGHRR